MTSDIPHAPLLSLRLSRILSPNGTEVQLPTPDVTHEYWIMYFNGSVMAPGSGAGVILISPDGSRLRYAIHLHFSTSNNTMEYEALINRLCIAIELGTR